MGTKARKPRPWDVKNRNKCWGTAGIHDWVHGCREGHYVVLNISITSPMEMRKLADWLNRAADWMESKKK